MVGCSAAQESAKADRWAERKVGCLAARKVEARAVL